MSNRVDPASTLPLLVGEAPSQSGDRYWMAPCSGGPARAICSWMGWTYEGAPYWRLVQSFETHNLIERWPGPQGKGAAFPMRQAREAWEELRPGLAGRVVVLLGRRLADVATISRMHDWFNIDGVHVVAIPHPSGLNHVYNDPAERERSAGTLRLAMSAARHRPEPGGCTCGFCAWSDDHVLVMAQPKWIERYCP